MYAYWNTLRQNRLFKGETLTPPRIHVIAAVTDGLGLGGNNKLLWNFKRDLKWFQKKTSGKYKAVVMGRNTWNSLPKKMRPLPDRMNFVVSSSLYSSYQSTSPIVYRSLEEVIEFASILDIQDLYVIGGSKMYLDAIVNFPLETIILTRIKTTQYDGFCDTWFPTHSLWQNKYYLSWAKPFYDIDMNPNTPIWEFQTNNEKGCQIKNQVELEYQIWKPRLNKK